LALPTTSTSCHEGGPISVGGLGVCCPSVSRHNRQGCGACSLPATPGAIKASASSLGYRNAAAADGVGFTRGIGKLYEPRAGAMKVMISRVQALKRHAWQEAASTITQSSEGSDTSGAKIRCQAA
jgi:MinD superfamily P-loop ATPase